MRATVCATIFDIDVYAEVDFTCTYKGFPGTYDEPPEAPEFSVDEVSLFRDNASKTPEPLDCPKWLELAIAASDAAYDAMRDVYIKEKR